YTEWDLILQLGESRLKGLGVLCKLRAPRPDLLEGCRILLDQLGSLVVEDGQVHGLLVHLSGSVEILRDHHRVVPPLRFRIELVSVLLVVVARTGFDALGPQCLEQRSQRSSGL